MNGWLEPLERALDNARGPLRVFFRDDDAGWGDDELMSLLDIFERHGVFIDVAVIPDACTPALAGRLASRLRSSGGRLGLHQHGFRHVNHEPAGRKCEFGPVRTEKQQTADLQAGKARLEDLLGAVLDPIFTPPWNRCTQTTADVLPRCHYTLLSRDITAVPLALGGLAELPVAVDWCRWTRETGGLSKMGVKFAELAADGGPVGIMLHHAAMEPRELVEVESLLALISDHSNVHCEKMISALPALQGVMSKVDVSGVPAA